MHPSLPRLHRAMRRHVETRTKGQSLVELALILPIFMLFFAAVLDLGRIAAAQIAVQNAAREGAFQAAVTPDDFDASTGCPPGGKTNVIFCRIKLESSGGVTISPSDVDVTCHPANCTTGIGNTVTVEVTGHFQLLTPVMGVLFGGQNVAFTASSVQNRETLPAAGSGSGAAPSAPPSAAPSGSASAAPSASSMTCTLPSAGFTFVLSGSPSHQAPQTVTVTDTSTSINCGITDWFWTWGDGSTTSGRVPGPHSYIAPNPDKSGSFTVSLKVTNAAGSTTVGGVQIQVK